MKDPAFVFEALARFAFNDCLKAQDPWGIAKQEKYSVFTDKNRISEAKMVLGKVFVGVLLRNNSLEAEHKLLKLEERKNDCNNQSDFSQIIHDAHRILELI
jgi:hypothetical protein